MKRSKTHLVIRLRYLVGIQRVNKKLRPEDVTPDAPLRVHNMRLVSTPNGQRYQINSTVVRWPYLTEQEALRYVISSIERHCAMAPSAAEAMRAIAETTARRKHPAQVYGPFVAYRQDEADVGIVAAYHEASDRFSLAFPDGWHNYYRNIEPEADMKGVVWVI